MGPVPSRDHLARLCLPNDRKTQSEIVTHHDDWGKPFCKNCGWQTAVVRFLKLGLCLCETCFLNPKSSPPFWHLLDESNYNSANFLDFDSSYSSCSSSLVDSNCPFPNGSLSVINEDSSSSFDYTKNSYNSAYSFFYFDSSSSSSSYSPSFVDRNCPFPNGSLSVINEDSSSSFENFQIDENYTKNNNGDEQVPMLRPDHLDIAKDNAYSCFNGYETKEGIENVLLDIFDGDEAVLIDLKEHNHDGDLILPDQLIDEITNHSAETTSTKIISSSSSGMSSVTHKDYNIEALGNAGSQDFNINQMIGSKAKEETNNRAIFPNALVQLDCGQSQLILAREMLPWENQLTYVHVKRYTPQERKEALKRYFAKKKRRKFVRHIRYESRKSTADTKRRMKGRFIKAGAEYDYDPRANNIKKGTHKKS